MPQDGSLNLQEFELSLRRLAEVCFDKNWPQLMGIVQKIDISRHGRKCQIVNDLQSSADVFLTFTIIMCFI